MSKSNHTEYVLSMDGEGRRFWLCKHPNGEEEPLPPDFALRLTAGIVELEDGRETGLPLGTQVKVLQPQPAVSAGLQKEAVREVVRNYLRKTGNLTRDEDVDKVLEEYAKGRFNIHLGARVMRAEQEVHPPPDVVPSSQIDVPAHQQIKAAKLGAQE